MSRPVVSGQLRIDFDYDDRVERMATEYAIMLIPYLPPGTPRETVKGLSARLAILAGRRLARHEEPREMIRCHSCDAETAPDCRVRVVVCVRCATEGRSPGSDG